MRPLTYLRIVGCVFFALATLELCARTEDLLRLGAPFTTSYSIESLYGNDALGKHGLPYASYMKWKLNSAGFRGPSLQSGKYRVITIGSSETFGIFESPDHEWPRQLEQKLNAGLQDRPYEVVNTAYPGMSIGYSRKRLPATLGQLRPQMAIIYPTYGAYIGWTPDKGAKSAAAPEKVPFQPRISGKLKDFFQASIPESVQHRFENLSIRLQSRGGAMDRLPEANVQIFSSDLSQLISDLQKAGVQVVLLTHANRFGTEHHPDDSIYLTNWRAAYPKLRQEGFLDMERRMTSAVLQVGAERKVPIIDAATLIQPGGRNFADFVHFTDAGADALSSLVANQLHDQWAKAPVVPGRDQANELSSASTAADITRQIGYPVRGE